MEITQITLKNVGKTTQFETTLTGGSNILSANKDVFNALCYFAQSWTNRSCARDFVRGVSEKSAFELELIENGRKFSVTYSMHKGQIVAIVCLDGTQLPGDSAELTEAFSEYLFPHEVAQYSFFDGAGFADYAQMQQKRYLQATLDDVREALTSQGRVPTDEELLGCNSPESSDGKSSYAMYRFIWQYLQTAQPVVLTTEKDSVFFDGANFTANGEVLDLNEPMSRTLLSRADEQLAQFCFANTLFRAEWREQGFRHNFPVVMWGLTRRQAQTVQNNMCDVQQLIFISASE